MCRPPPAGFERPPELLFRFCIVVPVIKYVLFVVGMTFVVDVCDNAAVDLSDVRWDVVVAPVVVVGVVRVVEDGVDVTGASELVAVVVFFVVVVSRVIKSVVDVMSVVYVVVYVLSVLVVKGVGVVLVVVVVVVELVVGDVAGGDMVGGELVSSVIVKMSDVAVLDRSVVVGKSLVTAGGKAVGKGTAAVALVGTVVVVVDGGVDVTVVVEEQSHSIDRYFGENLSGLCLFHAQVVIGVGLNGVRIGRTAGVLAPNTIRVVLGIVGVDAVEVGVVLVVCLTVELCNTGHTLTHKSSSALLLFGFPQLARHISTVNLLSSAQQIARFLSVRCLFPAQLFGHLVQSHGSQLLKLQYGTSSFVSGKGHGGGASVTEPPDADPAGTAAPGQFVAHVPVSSLLPGASPQLLRH